MSTNKCKQVSIHDPLFDSETGEPILRKDGTPATWMDLVAKIGGKARREGKRLEITDGPEGETLYRIVDET